LVRNVSTNPLRTRTRTRTRSGRVVRIVRLAVAGGTLVVGSTLVLAWEVPIAK
jgi:hypothetical protein